MFRSHFDHRVGQSRIVTDMMSSDGDLGLEFTSIRMAYCFRPTQSDLSLTWVQHTSRCVRAVEIVTHCEVSEAL